MENTFTPRRIVAVGDIHGHYDELMALWQQLLHNAFDPRIDQLVILGDLVDVGPKTKEVVEQCMQWQQEFPHFVFLYGNHEDMMIDALNPKHPQYGDYYIWWNQGGKETLKSYQPDGFSDYEKAIMQPQDYLSAEHIKWLANLPYYYETPDYVFVHGGLPNEPLTQIHEKLMQNDQELIQKLIWIRDEFIYSRFDWGKTIVYAHTPTVEPLNGWNKIGLNTMPRNEGKLTGLEIPSMRYFFQPKL